MTGKYGGWGVLGVDGATGEGDTGCGAMTFAEEAATEAGRSEEDEDAD